MEGKPKDAERKFELREVDLSKEFPRFRGEATEKGLTWGHWRWEVKHPHYLTFKCEGIPEYDMELAKEMDANMILGWVYHLHYKGWTTPQDVDDMLTAFEDLLGRIPTSLSRKGVPETVSAWKELDSLKREWSDTLTKERRLREEHRLREE
jgi:hypothetical protein